MNDEFIVIRIVPHRGKRPARYLDLEDLEKGGRCERLLGSILRICCTHVERWSEAGIHPYGVSIYSGPSYSFQTRFSCEHGLGEGLCALLIEKITALRSSSPVNSPWLFSLGPGRKERHRLFLGLAGELYRLDAAFPSSLRMCRKFLDSMPRLLEYAPKDKVFISLDLYYITCFLHEALTEKHHLLYVLVGEKRYGMFSGREGELKYLRYPESLLSDRQSRQDMGTALKVLGGLDIAITGSFQQQRFKVRFLPEEVEQELLMSVVPDPLGGEQFIIQFPPFGENQVQIPLELYALIEEKSRQEQRKQEWHSAFEQAMTRMFPLYRDDFSKVLKEQPLFMHLRPVTSKEVAKREALSTEILGQGKPHEKLLASLFTLLLAREGSEHSYIHFSWKAELEEGTTGPFRREFHYDRFLGRRAMKRLLESFSRCGSQVMKLNESWLPPICRFSRYSGLLAHKGRLYQIDGRLEQGMEQELLGESSPGGDESVELLAGPWDSEEFSPMVALRNCILYEWMRSGSETLHLCCHRDRFLVLHRNGKELQCAAEPPVVVYEEVVDSIRILAGMDIANPAPFQEGTLLSGVPRDSGARPLKVACILDPFGELRLVLGFSLQAADWQELDRDYLDSLPGEGRVSFSADYMETAEYLIEYLAGILPRPEGLREFTVPSPWRYGAVEFPNPFKK